MFKRYLKLKAVFIMVLAIVILPLFVPPWRDGLLIKAGQALIHHDELQQAEAIVIAVDGTAPEVLEAVDLVRAGYAPKVWVLAGPQDELGLEFARRGLPYADKATVAVSTLNALGVNNAEIAPYRVDGTNSEIDLLPRWLAEKQYKKIIFVVVADHSGRVRRMLDRALIAEKTSLTILVRYSKFAQYKAEDWWRARGGIRTVIVEYQKLLLDVLQHPI
jgi:uncharacterized SAM-binding protein YcdF (DUF218 family)